MFKKVKDYFSQNLKVTSWLKQVIMVFLLLIAITLWANILFLGPNKKDRESTIAHKKLPNQTESQPTIDNFNSDFTTSKLYNTLSEDRKSPFLTSKEDQAEFSYQKLNDKEIVDKLKNKQAQIINLKADLIVTGLLKRQNDYLAVVQDKNRSYLIERGDKIKGYQVIKIVKEKIKFKKQDKYYRLKVKLDDYN
ncbi:hypothetical protein JCM16358_09300 [Halanaerocella petrolearia]